MRKAIVVGLLVFIGILLVRAPAALIELAIDEGAPFSLLTPDGTLWNGQGTLLVQGVTVGELSWSLQPGRLLTGRLAYDLAIAGADIDLGGELAAGLGPTSALARGQVGAAFVNQWLAPYDIRLDGEFTISDVTVTLIGHSVSGIGGTIAWNGGPVTYLLSGKLYNSALPPMRALLGPGPEAIAFATGDETPLLLARLEPNGFAKVGVTKYLTKILGNPWPGGDPDHAVVLEVEEQVF